ncbi:CAZyme family GH30 [Purpureocillium lilacinum]|uniref:CAZyme family GH30 n=1 Tax=Purpureocillium lilacinum TaxID=33203 RepID=A0ABR0CCG6_PURLI|nr:CAZyme family GH30 [Purpureocillium lilacinum]
MHVSIVASLAGRAALGVAFPSDDGATAFASNSNGSLKLSPVPPPVLGDGNPGPETWNLTIDDAGNGGYKQKITGFGAAVTDATVTTFNTLPNDALDSLLNTLMTSDGAGFSLMRHTIGASDLSAYPPYTYDDSMGQPDPNLTHFGLHKQGRNMTVLLKHMKDRQPDLKVIGSSWSAPGWMKQNGKLIDGNTATNNLWDIFHGPGSPNYSSAFAQYFVKYIQTFQERGVPIYAITIQNEPMNNKAGFPTMDMIAEEQAVLIASYILPAFREENITTQIWAYDHNTGMCILRGDIPPVSQNRIDHPRFPQTVLDLVGRSVNTVAWHCYADVQHKWKTMKHFYQRYREMNRTVDQYMTECWTPSRNTTWHQAADFTMGPLRNWGSGVISWPLGANSTDGPYLPSNDACHSCTGLVTINDNGTYTFQTAYYMMAQFSKFMPPGSTVLHDNGTYVHESGAGISAVASETPDGSRTVVIKNTFGNDIYVFLNTTSGQKWSGNIPMNSVTTWVLPVAFSDERLDGIPGEL